jgi:hypothetical protein
MHACHLGFQLGILSLSRSQGDWRYFPGLGDLSPVCVFKSPLGHEYWCDFPKTAST